MTMHVNFSPEMARYIQKKVKKGFYGNATEVIRDALRRMQSEEERVASFQRAVAKGEAQIRRRKSAPYTAKLSKNILRKGLARAETRRPIVNTDILPDAP